MPPTALSAISHELVETRDGYWSGPVERTVSYPGERSVACFEAEGGSGWFAHRTAVLRDVLDRFEPTGTLFDVGAGNGFVALALQEGGWDVVAVEPTREATEHAWERGVRPVIWSTLEDAGFEDGSLPAVGLFDVLEHVDDRGAHLALVHRLLSPGGRLYLTVPAHRWLWSAHDVQAGHHTRYSRARLRRELADAGFTVEHLSAFFGVLPLPILVRRSLPSLWGRRAGAAAPLQGYPDGPRSPLARLLDHRYRAERVRLRRRSQRIGSSLVAVARKGERP